MSDDRNVPDVVSRSTWNRWGRTRRLAHLNAMKREGKSYVVMWKVEWLLYLIDDADHLKSLAENRRPVEGSSASYAN